MTAAELGRQAFIDGLSENDNPYPHEIGNFHKRAAWLISYEKAKHESGLPEDGRAATKHHEVQESVDPMRDADMPGTTAQSGGGTRDACEPDFNVLFSALREPERAVRLPYADL